MIEVDRERDLEPLERIEASPLVGLFHLDWLLDADKPLRRVLLFHAGGLDQEYEKPHTTIHDRHLGRAQNNKRENKAETSEGGQQKHDGRDTHVAVHMRRRQG